MNVTFLVSFIWTHTAKLSVKVHPSITDLTLLSMLVYWKLRPPLKLDF